VSFFFPERRAVKYAGTPPRDPVVAEWWGGSSGTASGASVTADSAMRVSAVFACVRVLAESVASLPCHLHKRTPDDGKERASGNSLYPVLKTRPNRFQTAFQFWEMAVAHAALRGNGYAEIVTAPNGRIELIPRHPDRITPFWAPDGLPAYHYAPLNGPSRTILFGEMFHLAGLSDDGLSGLSPVRLHRESIGLAMATEEHGARLFSNGANPGGVLEHPGILTDEAYKRLKESWSERHAGLSNAHKPAILEEGLKWTALGMSNEDAQFLETRKYQVTDIARIFRVPPHMVNDLDRATFSNIEQQSIDFVVNTLRPWLVRIEQAISRDLILPSQQADYFAEFLIDGLMRGDIQSRYRAYATGRQWGWLSANDIRRLENQNPIENGDVYLSPTNMTPANQLSQTPDPSNPNDPAQN
jgi:HK97 family phage portal protein